MKPFITNNTLSPARRTVCASALVLILGAATAVAQSGAAAGSSSGDTTRRNQTGTTSGATGTYDAGTSTTPGTSSATGTTRGTYGADATSTTAGTATGRDSAMGREKLSWGDRRFINKAADDGHAEHQIAQLAAQRATNTEVRNFAQKLVDEHSKVNAELKTLASQKSVKVDMDDDHDRAY